eukprot:3242578-Prymnesium_polylepis.1
MTAASAPRPGLDHTTDRFYNSARRMAFHEVQPVRRRPALLFGASPFTLAHGPSHPFCLHRPALASFPEPTVPRR